MVGSTVHWNAERLAVDHRYPLSAELNEVMHPNMWQRKARPGVTSNKRATKKQPNKGAGASAVHVRNQIVSPDLCGMLYPG
jgi:hypothetical protein